MILRQILKGNLKYYLFLFFLVIFMDFFSPLREEVSAQQHFFLVFIFQFSHRAILDKPLKIALSTTALERGHSQDKGTLD